MNLYFMPNAANDSCGHCIEITRSLDRLKPNEKDSIIVWYANSNSGKYMTDKDYYIKRKKLLSFHTFKNILSHKIHTTVSRKQLSFLNDLKIKDSDFIHLEDPMFYDAFRSYFPKHYIFVHFHNVFLRIKIRTDILNLKVDAKYRVFMNLFSKLEIKIFNDKNVKKIFISKEDAAFYHEMTGNDDYEVWPVDVNRSLMAKNRTSFKWNKKIVWVGGIKAHKKYSVQRFISDVFFPLRKTIPDLEFHLWGNGSQQFDSPTDGIYGHGFLNGNLFPFKTDSIYINPDLTGGGVKIKVKTYLENGLTVLSTPFGFEGYDYDLIDNKYCSVVPFSYWTKYIIENY